jgi:hypothetical protein
MTEPSILSVAGWNDLSIARLAKGSVMVRNASGHVTIPTEAIDPLRSKLAELDVIPRLSQDRDALDMVHVADGVDLGVCGDGVVVIVAADWSTVGLEIGEIGRVVRGLGA